MENQINIAQEVAKYALEDGQMARPFHEFFNSLYDEIKGKKFEFEGQKFTDRAEFLIHLSEVANDAANLALGWKCDEPDEYEKAN